MRFMSLGMTEQLAEWKLSILLILSAVLLLLLTLVALVVAAIAVKALVVRRRQRRLRDALRHERFGPDGRPYPPCGRGLCDRCKQAFDDVHYLSSGERLCHGCYRERLAGAAARRPEEPA